MTDRPLHKYSLLVFLLFAITIITINYRHPRDNIIAYDEFGYYLYLPGFFIYDQLEFSDDSLLQAINDEYQLTGSLYQITRAPNGNSLIRYPSGLAIMYAPFFLAGHVLSFWYEAPADGFSWIYHYALLAGGILYSLIGIWFLRKVLLKFFSDGHTALVLLILLFATNYFYKAAFKGIAPHNLLFTVYALILWLTIRWHEAPRVKYALGLGFLCGLAILSRPSEMVCLLIPLLWNVTGWQSLKDKLRLLSRNPWHIILFILAAFLVAIPQMAYWKHTTGSLLFYSYNNPGEGFDFLWPYTLKVLLSFRKGWLIYTPVMVFSLVGFYYLYRMNRKIFLPVFLFFLVNLWFVSSWSNWWYAESFGQRALVQSYAVLSIPLGYFIVRLSGARARTRWMTGSLIGIFLILNLFQSWQMRAGILDGSRMTANYYFSVFGKTSVSEDKKKFLLADRSVEVFEDEAAYRSRILADQGFETPQKGKEDRYSPLVKHSGAYSFRLDSALAYSPAQKARYREITRGEYAWIRVSAFVYSGQEIPGEEILLVATFENRHGLYKYRAVHPEGMVPAGQWTQIGIDYMTPEVRSKRDRFSAYIWNRGKSEIFVDDLRVEVFDKN